MPEHAGDKSQDATPHRRQKAREQGQVAFSQDLGSAALLLLGVLSLMMMGARVIEFVALQMQLSLGDVPPLAADRSILLNQWQTLLSGFSTTLLPILGMLLLGSVAVSVFQVGFLWVPERIRPDPGRLSPLKGVQRIFSLQGTMRLSFGMFKVLVIFAVAAAFLWTRKEEVLASAALEIPQLAGYLVEITLDTLLWCGLALCLLAAFDYAFQRWKHEQDIRMTSQEVREELKNLQGDPQIIARRRAIQRQMVLNRLESSVPKADVIVTNPTELAIALRYEPESMAAPVVVAKGAGVLAQRIRRLALEHNIPIVERKPLARLLYKDVDVNHPIPDDSYAAVAEVLAYVYQLKGKSIPQPPG